MAEYSGYRIYSVHVKHVMAGWEPYMEFTCGCGRVSESGQVYFLAKDDAEAKELVASNSADEPVGACIYCIAELVAGNLPIHELQPT